jgi:hypothetical protein
MGIQSFSGKVSAYQNWKRHLQTEIANYQAWLSENDIESDDLQIRLQRGLNMLREDELTIAFVGEYSRGKTELINAIVFAESGKRILPSQAGRTTMCPTELFYDHHRDTCYMRLLPIETRLQERSIADFKKDPDAWHEVPLDPTDPDKMSYSLRQVASTRVVSRAEARSLGFDENLLDAQPGERDRVVIPAWRHALISIDSSLLKKGVRILDTPGLNALGSEPELTISMIPKAHAVIFVLSADTGVTASDLTIWRDYITTQGADHRAGRFAVLNKIDVLWDDIQGPAITAENIERVTRSTAEHLNIAADDVIPVSAKQGLIGKARHDDDLLKRSALMRLEKLISNRIMADKEKLISEGLTESVLEMLQSSQSMLKKRLASLYERKDSLSCNTVTPETLQDLAERTHRDHDHYYKKLITLKSSRRLLQSQGDILQQIVGKEQFEVIIEQTRKALNDSWSTLGMNRSMREFFEQMERMIDGVLLEARMADKMVGAIYQRFTVDIGVGHFKPKPFSIQKQRQRLRALQTRSIQFRRNPKMIMTEQTLLIKRFFGTFVMEARDIHQQILNEAVRWPDEALLPLMQYTLEQRKLLEKQVATLKSLASSSKDVQSQQTALEEMIRKVSEQLIQVENITRRLRRIPPNADEVALSLVKP